MADILRIGLSALLAQQRALATTSNNIANANTPGYSRQRVELTERPVERYGDELLGTGVQVDGIRRLTDDILADQIRTAAGGFSRAGAFVGLAETLDDMLAGAETGLTATMQSFVNALQDIANDPSSTSARQVLISEARNLVSRFESMDQRMTQIGDELRSRMTAATAEINSLGAGIAEVNRKILDAGVATGRPAPPDLLDQRDRLLERLSELVQVDTTMQRDGSMSVFIGTGQVLVLGTDAAELAVTAGTTDPDQPQIVLRGTGPDVDITRFVTGGELGGLLDFNREMLAPARSELGRIAMGLVTTVNAVHRNGMDADGQLGGDFFAIGAPQTYAAAGNSGSGAVGVTITDVAALQPANYRLAFDGAAYTLQRADNGAVVPMTGAGTSGSPFVADGLSIVVSGAPNAGDQFLLKPVEHAPGTMGLLVTRPADVAAAAPTRTSAALANIGTGSISAGEVVDVSHLSLLSTATIEFIDATNYSIDGAGTFAYTPGANIDINGTRVQLTGAPAAGDQFVIQSNAGGTGDNRNAQALVARLGQSVFDGNVTLQGAASGLVTGVGARTAEAANQRDAQQFVLTEGRERLDSVRGVNLDEEAADLLRYQQLYQAAAQTMAVAGSLFNTLLAALGR
jgi:flagellar hook-associated protein 1 FlgK